MMVNSFRIRAALSAAGAAVVAALILVAAPAAHAEDLWGGIFTGPGGNWQIVYDQPTWESASYFGNYTNCRGVCRRVLVFKHCAALAYKDGAFSAVDADRQADAEAAVLGDLPGSRIVASGCNGAGTASAWGPS